MEVLKAVPLAADVGGGQGDHGSRVDVPRNDLVIGIPWQT